MTQVSRRLFLLLLGALVPGALNQHSDAATTKTPSPTPSKKKSTPTPTKKKATPTPTSKKSTTSPTATNAGKTSPSAQSSPSKSLEGLAIAKSSELALRQTRVFYLKDSFGISTGYSLTRTTRGVVAFDVKCTHNGVPTNVSGMQLKCPAHGSIFNPETGEVIRGPAAEPLKSYKTVESDGEIRIIIS